MKHNVPVTLILVSVFFLAQIVGLFIIQNYVDVAATAESGVIVYEELPLGVERPEIDAKYSFIYIISAVLIGTVLLLLLIKFKFRRLWKVWYFIAIFIALVIAFNAFMPTIVAAVLGLLIALWKSFKPNVVVHNLSELFIYGGLAVIFVPIMNVFAAIMLLFLISIYDMYAVWKSKHMIKLAQFQSKSNMFAGFYVPYGKEIKIKNNKTSVKMSKKAVKVKMKVKSAVLGGGDIAFPLLFSGVVFADVGFWTLVITVTTSIALFGLLTFGKKNRFYPAMPYLTVGCLIGYAIIRLFV
jgi:presenilin-like A22 family membrane protease